MKTVSKLKITEGGIQTAMFFLLAVIFCLIRFPSFYIVPFSASSIFLTHNIARACIALLFLMAVTVKHKPRMSYPLFGTVLLYFIASSASIITTGNIGSFFTVYKDLILSLMLAYGAFMAISEGNLRRFVNLAVWITVVGLAAEFLIYLFPQVLIPLFAQVVNSNYYAFFNYQFGRGRMFGDTLNEVFLPVFFYTLTESGWMRKLPSGLGIFLGFFSTFISGWRTKAIIYCFGLVSGMVSFGRKYAGYVIAVLVVTGAALLISNYLTLATNSFSIIERFTDLDSAEVKNDASRLRFWKEAMDIGLSSPIFGVGLGNYFDHLPQTSKTANLSGYSATPNGSKFIIIDDPHNLFFGAFAYTGIVGLASLVILVGYMAVSDVQAWLKNNRLLQSLILSFWCLFVYALLNPWMYFAYLSFFWLLRGVIEKTKLIYSQK